MRRWVFSFFFLVLIAPAAFASPLSWSYLTPRFGILYIDAEQTVKLEVNLAPEVDLSRAMLRGIISLDGHPFLVKTVGPPLSGRTILLEYNVEQLEIGCYEVKVELVGGEAVLGPSLVKVPNKTEGVVLNEEGTLLVSGVPFFPLGLYHVPRSDYPKIAAQGFNTVQMWGKDSQENVRRNLDAAETNGLKAVVELSPWLRNQTALGEIESAVRAYRDHPALLTWYPIDEPWGSAGNGDVAAGYDLIRRLDPYHPLLLVDYVVSSFTKYGEGAHIYAPDIYPIPNGDMARVFTMLQDLQNRWGRRRGYWAVLQLHNLSAYGVPGGRLPTPVEAKVMAYLAIVGGARGLLWYGYGENSRIQAGAPDWNAWQELWASFKPLNQELNKYAPVFLAENGPAWQVNPVQEGLRLYWTSRRDNGGNHYLILVNAGSVRGEVQIRPPVGGEPLVALKKGQVLYRQDDSFITQIEPYDTQIYSLTGGMPPLDLKGTIKLRLDKVLAYPNPVRGENWLTFRYELNMAAAVTLEIFDLEGKLVYAAPTLSPGGPGGREGLNQTLTWQLKQQNGQRIKPGLYFYRLHAAQGKQVAVATGRLWVQE